MEEHITSYSWPTPAMRASAAAALRQCLEQLRAAAALRQRLELLRAAALAARAILADVNGGAVDDDRAETVTRIGNAYQILDMALEDDARLDAGGTPPWKIHDERYGRALKINGEASGRHWSMLGEELWMEYDTLAASPRPPAERPDPYRWVDRVADEAGVVGGQGRSGGAMVTSAIIMIAGAALIAGVIAAAWVMSWPN